MRNTIILISLLFIAAIALASLYFSKLDVGARNDDRLLHFIPKESALIAEFRNDAALKEIFKDYKLFNAVLGQDKIEEINALQNILAQSKIKDAIDGENFFVSFHPNNNSTIDLLWLIPYKEKPEVINSFLTSNVNAVAKKENVYDLTITSIAKHFYFYMDKNVIVGSYSEALLKNSISGTVKIDKSYVDEIINSKQKSQNSPVNLYFNHSTLNATLLKIISGKQDDQTVLLSNLKGSTSLNMNFKSDALMFNGISVVDSTSNAYLNLYLHQKPIANTLQKIIPVGTSNFTLFGVSDYSKYLSDWHKLLKKRGELAALTNQFSIAQQLSGINIDQLTNFLSNESAVLQLANREAIGIAKLKNGTSLNNFLEPVSTSFSDKIRQFNNSNILYYFLGDPFKKFQRPYFTIADNYLIVANNTASIQQFLDAYQTEKALFTTPAFADFNQFTANQTNISFFISTKESQYLLRHELKAPYFQLFKNELYGLKNFYGLSYQWSAAGDHFFINVYANYLQSAGAH